MTEFIPHGYLRLSVAAGYVAAKHVQQQSGEPESEHLISGIREVSDSEVIVDRFRVLKVELAEYMYDPQDLHAVDITLEQVVEVGPVKPSTIRLAPPLETCFEDVRLNVARLPNPHSLMLASAGVSVASRACRRLN